MMMKNKQSDTDIQMLSSKSSKKNNIKIRLKKSLRKPKRTPLFNVKKLSKISKETQPNSVGTLFK